MGTWEEDFEDYVNASLQLAEQFTDFFRNPESVPAHDYLDPMAAAAYIVEENMVEGEGEGAVQLEDGQLTYSVE